MNYRYKNRHLLSPSNFSSVLFLSNVQNHKPNPNQLRGVPQIQSRALRHTQSSPARTEIECTLEDFMYYKHI